MTMRSSVSNAARRAQTSNGRATIREIDDDHLCQEVKQADAGHSDTPTNFEQWHPLGITSVAMKQEEDKQQQKGGQQGGGQQGGGSNDWNKKQPQGESAEAMMMYIGSREHPVGMVNDRRVRPYGLKPGEAGFYSPKGSGQMVYHRERGDGADGLYIVSCDDQGGGQQAEGGEQQATRIVSIRHTNKPKQRRKKQKKEADGSLREARAGEDTTGDKGELPDGSKSKYKHEGESVNTETQFTAQRINFNEGGGDVGYYDRKKDWMHYMPGDKKLSSRCDKDHTHIMSTKGAVVWVDKQSSNCYSSKPIIIKPDECDV